MDAEQFGEHEDKYGALPVHQKKLFTIGLLRVQNSLRPKLITDSFKEVGTHPLSAIKILQKCMSPISSLEMATILEQLPKLAKHLYSHGKLYDSDFIKAGIRKVGDEAMKDLLVLYRRRSCLLTNLELLERERAKVKEAEERKAIAERRRLLAREREKERNKGLLPLDWYRQGRFGKRDLLHKDRHLARYI